VVPDPGERQISKRLVALVELVEGDRVGRRVDAADGGENDTLRLPGSPRGVEDDRAVRAFTGFDLAVEPLTQRGVLPECGMTVPDDVVDRLRRLWS
jgi:hypothetical protein